MPKEKIKHSKYWNTMVNILESCFPKGLSKERGHALVMLSYIEMMLQGFRFDENGNPIKRSPKLKKIK